MKYSPYAIKAIAAAIRADSAGNEKATMTDMDIAANMLEQFAIDQTIAADNNIQSIVDFCRKKTTEQGVDYARREASKSLQILYVRKLGQWETENLPDVETAVDRIHWLLDGSYGVGEYFLAWQWIVNNLNGKTGKNVDKAWKAAGRECVLLLALLDNPEFNARKITEVWKKQGVDFNAVNEKAAAVIKGYISEDMNEEN